MVAIQPRPDAPQPKSRWFRITWLKLLVFTLLLAASGIGFVRWKLGLPPSEDYDKERYKQILGAIAADPKHLDGQTLDEVTKALSLEEVPWDDATVQQAGQYRIYHFRGFALHFTLKAFPPGAQTAKGEELRLRGVLWLGYPPPTVRIDGLDRQERMKRYWKAVDDECERINAKAEKAKIELRRQQSQK